MLRKYCKSITLGDVFFLEPLGSFPFNKSNALIKVRISGLKSNVKENPHELQKINGSPNIIHTIYNTCTYNTFTVV